MNNDKGIIDLLKLKQQGNIKIFSKLIEIGTVNLFCKNEFTLFFRKEMEEQFISSESMVLKNSEICENVLTKVYENSDVIVTVTYAAEKVLKKRLRIEAKTPVFITDLYVEESYTKETLIRGGEGQPIFVGGSLFVSLAFPAANNIILNDTIIIKQSPYIALSEGESFESFDVIFGIKNKASAEESFIEFIRQETRIEKKPIRIYCDWGAHDEISDSVMLDEAMASGLLQKLKEIKKTGMSFDYYLMDAFWYQNGLPYTEFRKEGWKNGPQKFLTEINENGLKFGLWFDINMGRIELKKDNQPVCVEGGEEFCLSHKENMDLLEKAIHKQIDECQITMLKFDFAYFECLNPAHKNHSKALTESKEPAIRFFVEMVTRLRARVPELIILAYNGFTTKLDYIGSVKEHKGYAVSPFWCYYLDYVYCGDPRPSEIASNSFSNSLTYYTDAMIYQFDNALFPREFIDDHGCMVGKTGTIYRLGKKGFRNTYLLNILRGTNKVHVYGDINEFDADDISFMKQSQTILFDIFEKKMSTVSVLGNPMKREVYGYVNFNEEEGYLTVINPSADEQTVSVHLPFSENCRFSFKRIYKKESLVKTEESQVINGFSLSIPAGNMEVFRFQIINQIENLPLYYKLNGVMDLKIPIQKSAKRIEINFTDENQEPVRTPFGLPEEVEIEFVNAEYSSLVNDSVWSGISWVSFEVSAKEESYLLIHKTKEAVINVSVLQKNI